LKLLVGSFDL